MGLARELRLLAWASRSSFIVRGASFGRGAGWAGIGWSGGATSGAGSLTFVVLVRFGCRVTAIGRYSVLTA